MTTKLKGSFLLLLLIVGGYLFVTHFDLIPQPAPINGKAPLFVDDPIPTRDSNDILLHVHYQAEVETISIVYWVGLTQFGPYTFHTQGRDHSWNKYVPDTKLEIVLITRQWKNGYVTCAIWRKFTRIDFDAGSTKDGVSCGKDKGI